jgi:hypothetical protein
MLHTQGVKAAEIPGFALLLFGKLVFWAITRSVMNWSFGMSLAAAAAARLNPTEHTATRRLTG